MSSFREGRDSFLEEGKQKVNLGALFMQSFEHLLISKINWSGENIAFF